MDPKQERIEELRRRMDSIRRDLPEEVEDLTDRARMLTDWKHYVRTYPWACLAGAAALGYLLVPSRRETIRLNAHAAGRLVDQQRSAVASAKSLSGDLAGRLAHILAKTALQTMTRYVGRQMIHLLDGRSAPDEEET